MHDINFIRNAPHQFAADLARRGLAVDVETLVARDKNIRAAKTEHQTLQGQVNSLSALIGKAMKDGDKDHAAKLRREVSDNKIRLRELSRFLTIEKEYLKSELLHIPNRLADDVPDGASAADNVVVKTREVADNPHAIPHYDIPVGFDFEAGAALSGSRFTVLRGEAARLHRRFGQMMIDNAIEHGFEEIVPPVLVHDAAMQGTGQLPKFAEDAWRVGDHWLIPTAEVSLTNLVADRINDLVEPIRMTALTPCFRREAGSAGRDTRGIIRQHQFDKVEVVAICRPEQVVDEHERIMVCAEAMLEKLGLGYRRVLLCAGDTGFSAHKTYDLEVWMAGTKEYREISSCSTFADFQGRRMNARYRGENGKTAFVHTLNGSALAVGRTLAAYLEQHRY